MYRLLIFCADFRDICTLEEFYIKKFADKSTNIQKSQILKNFQQIKLLLENGISLWEAEFNGNALYGFDDYFTRAHYSGIHPERFLLDMEYPWQEPDIIRIRETDDLSEEQKTLLQQVVIDKNKEPHYYGDIAISVMDTSKLSAAERLKNNLKIYKLQRQLFYDYWLLLEADKIYPTQKFEVIPRTKWTIVKNDDEAAILGIQYATETYLECLNKSKNPAKIINEIFYQK